jgi:hypothetical protein
MCTRKCTFMKTQTTDYIDLIKLLKIVMVPPAGIEPALREELDFESNASTSSAREALNAMYYMDLS